MKTQTLYIVWYYDPRGAWRECVSHHETRSAAKKEFDTFTGDAYIEKRDRTVVLERRVNPAHWGERASRRAG